MLTASSTTSWRIISFMFASKGRTVEMKAKGFSMRPFIRGGEDSLVLGPVRNIRKGDILFCRISQNNYVIHRLVRMDGKSLVLMGDGNIKGTERCSTDDVVAKVIRIEGKRRMFNCDSFCFRVLSFLWWKLLPLRCYLLAIFRAGEKIKNIVIKRN